MIDLEAARSLLDLGKRIGGGQRAEEQLRGAVAIHNILRQHRVAYLADEVGMGKTYVALGALALFRHFDPNFRVLFIAPRENIQKKWQKELTNFTAHNVLVDDLRVRALDGGPARPLVSCANLLELVTEASVDPDRDFFVRMSSFSLALSNSAGKDWSRLRDGLQHQLPWFSSEALALHNKEAFKRNFAKALCCALPRFDLVIVDEAHNFRHGFSTSGSARNQVLAEVLGRPSETQPDPRLFPGHGPRAARVLFLSATPIEESYRHLWNQLDLFGLSEGFSELRDEQVPEARKRELAAQILVRRVTSLNVAGRPHTKNMYRREWRSGGVSQHDQPIAIQDDRQRLIVALVQKKVSELLSGKQFNRSFQIGMLASFESFLQTAKLKSKDEELPTFDDAEQTDIAAERDGIDVHDVNRLARSYRQTFGEEMPHPKMDAVVDSLASAWTTGRKSLVFVRRVASVKELKRKLDDRYDGWLIPTVRERLPEALRAPFNEVVAQYRIEKERRRPQAEPDLGEEVEPQEEAALENRGGNDTFFAWFFRGEGPKDIVSGANIQGRFIQSSGAYATFFSDNLVMDLLQAEPDSVLGTLASAVGLPEPELVVELRARAAKYLSRKAQTVTRASRFEAAQAAALELLRERANSTLSKTAAIYWDERYRTSLAADPAREAPPEIAHALETPTFFTELRRPERAELRAQIWPASVDPAASPETLRAQFREQVLRAEVLASAARLGHAFIDLYVAAMSGRTSLSTERGAATAESQDDAPEAVDAGKHLLHTYLDMLEEQRRTAGGRTWGAFDELHEIASNFDLIVDVNLPDARTAALSESARYIGSVLRQQQPIGGMAGQVNQTLVRQFRMPGYPFVLITTDLLQEGEDLHTFCSSVHHYGISYTASAMEQRIGRVDRVRSQTDRRLSSLGGEPTGEDWLQVYFPYLQDTVEVLQVERVLDRMNTFLRLMHEGLAAPEPEQRQVNVGREIVAARKRIEAIRDPLRSAFPISDAVLRGPKTRLAVGDWGPQLRERLLLLRQPTLGGLPVTWEANAPQGSLLGTVQFTGGRSQPFALTLGSEAGHPVVHCVSTIGHITLPDDEDSLLQRAARLPSRLAAALTKDKDTFTMSIEDDVVLGAPEHDTARVGTLVRRVTEQADQVEREHFGNERDAPLEALRAELVGEETTNDP